MNKSINVTKVTNNGSKNSNMTICKKNEGRWAYAGITGNLNSLVIGRGHQMTKIEKSRKYDINTTAKF